MEAPKCKICGSRHYGICPTLPDIPAKTPLKEPEKKPESRIDAEVLPKKIGYDRNAYHKQYMRGYMRKRRAAKKADSS